MDTESIVVSKESYEAEDEYEIILSNIDFINALKSGYVYEAELSIDSLLSYYVDYYQDQLGNGGFSQFVYNTGWNVEAVKMVRLGLLEMNAVENLSLFDKAAGILDKLGQGRIAEYLESEYFGTNAERDILDSFDDEFYDLQEVENLIHFNHVWLKHHPKLKVMTSTEINAAIKKITDTIPDKEQRINLALDTEPRYMKLIRSLCKKSGQELERITAGDPTHQHDGKGLLAWHFITNSGHHYMVDYKGEAIMFNGGSNEIIAKIPAGVEYGE
jgi:hypothetical protein